jgi:hypothetical protein
MPNYRRAALAAPTVQTVNLCNVEFVSWGVIPAGTIQFDRLSSCKYPDEARHFSSGRAPEDLEMAESLADDPVDIEPKNTSVRELCLLHASDRRPEPTCNDDGRSRKDLQFGGIRIGIVVYPNRAVFAEEHSVAAAEQDLSSTFAGSHNCVLGDDAPGSRRWVSIDVRTSFNIRNRNSERGPLRVSLECTQRKEHDSHEPSRFHVHLAYILSPLSRCVKALAGCVVARPWIGGQCCNFAVLMLVGW